MKVSRRMEVTINKETPFEIGDRIQVGECFTATCQEVGKNGAVFMLDQYLDESYAMNPINTNKGGYEKSLLRNTLKRFESDAMFDEIRDKMVPFENGDLLRIPMAEEMFSPEEMNDLCEIDSNKKQWELMKDRRNRIAFHRDDSEVEFGRLQNKYKDSTSNFCIVTSSGDIICSNAFYFFGVRVVFQLSMKRGE